MCPQKLEVYKCNHCGNIVEVLNGFKPPMSCCGENMVLMKENTVDASKEKHVPVIKELSDGGIMVKVGSEPHPMTEQHYIEWIQVVLPDREVRVNLKPGQVPEAKFCMKPKNFTVRAYCNLHGLWKGE